MGNFLLNLIHGMIVTQSSALIGIADSNTLVGKPQGQPRIMPDGLDQNVVLTGSSLFESKDRASARISLATMEISWIVRH